MTPVFGARHSRRRKWRSPRRSIYECYELTRADFMTVARRFHYHFLKRRQIYVRPSGERFTRGHFNRVLKSRGPKGRPASIPGPATTFLTKQKILP